MSLHNLTEKEFDALKKRVKGTAPRTAMTHWKDSPEAKHSPMRKVSGSTLSPRHAPSPTKYSSKWELQYSKVLDVEKRVGAIKDWRYGGISFTLSKGQYHRIDFLIWHNNGQIELAQVKGYHPNMRAGIKGLKWAAQLHPWFSWTIKRWTGTCWDGSYVEI